MYDTVEIYANDANEIHAMTCMTVYMRPLLLSLRIFGITHFAHNGKVQPISVNSSNRKEFNKKQNVSKLLRGYCIFVCCLLILNALRYIPCFWVGVDFVPGLITQRLVVFLWYIQNAITAIVLFVFFDKKDHFERYTEQYKRVIYDHVSKRLKINPGCTKIRRCIIKHLLIGWSIVIINTVLVIILSFSDISPGFAVIICNPFPYDSVIVRLLGCLIQFVSSGVWVLPVVLHYNLTSAIQTRFEELYLIMEHTVSEQPEDQFEILRNIRQKHLQLCKIVETVDQSLSYYIANIYAMNIGIACFATYEIVNKTSFAVDIPAAITLTFWIVASFFQMFIISEKSATLHEKVRITLPSFFGARTRPSWLTLVERYKL